MLNLQGFAFAFQFAFLQAAGDRASVFKIISSFFPVMDFRFRLIEKAYNDAKDAFRGKYREGGERYFEHIRATVLILILYLRVTDYRLIVAMILHDIVEDIPSWTIERVRAEYGDEIAMWVDYLSKPTKTKGLTDEEREFIYHNRFKFAPRLFFLMKLADRLHNTLTLGTCSLEKQRRKVAETYRYYIPYAEEHLILYHELMAALAWIEAGWQKK